MNLKGKKVLLRAIEEKDLEILRKMINDQDFEYKVVGYSFPVSTLQQKRWYENTINDKRNLKLVIEYDEKTIGLATLDNIDWKNRSAFHGMKLINEAQGKGIGKDVVMTICSYAFNELQLNRLEGGMLETNIPSLKLYEKCGWKKEGLFRQYAYKNGRYLDYYPVSILREEFKND